MYVLVLIFFPENKQNFVLVFCFVFSNTLTYSDWKFECQTSWCFKTQKMLAKVKECLLFPF